MIKDQVSGDSPWITEDWVSLLPEPKAIRGAYGDQVPSLSNFFLHCIKCGPADGFSVAGELGDLPRALPPEWHWNGRPIAYVTFNFYAVKSLSLDFSTGMPCRGPLADMLFPCALELTTDLWAEPKGRNPIFYKRFVGSNAGTKIDVVAGSVYVEIGQKAMRTPWANLPTLRTKAQ
jgi:hypothetical protein